MAAHVVDARGSGAPSALTPPRALPSVEGYEVRQQLAETQASDIYLAVHTASGALRTLAIQRIESDPAAVRRMVSEVLDAGRVKHPGIALVDGVGTTRDNRLYVATAYIEGVTLGELLASEGHLPARRALQIALRAAEALEAAHRMGVTHGELTPEQIIVGPAGADGVERVTVTGFGMSAERTLVPLKADRPYASPERLSAGKLDQRSDVFSLASVLLHVLSGNAPPPPRGARGGTPAASPAVRPGSRPAPAQVLLTARATEPERRYPTIAAFREALMLAFGADDATRRTPENPLGIMRATPVPSAKQVPVVQPGIAPVANPMVEAPPADVPFAGAPASVPAAPAPTPVATHAVAAPTPVAAPAVVPPAPRVATPIAASPAVAEPIPAPTPVAQPAVEPMVQPIVEPLAPPPATPFAPVATVAAPGTPPATPTMFATSEPAVAPTAIPLVSAADTIIPIVSAPPAPTDSTLVTESVFESLGRPSYSEPLFTAPANEPLPMAATSWAEPSPAAESWAPISAPAVRSGSAPVADAPFRTPVRNEPVPSRPAADRRVWLIGGATAATLMVVGALLLRPQPAPIPPAPAAVSHLEVGGPAFDGGATAATPAAAPASSGRGGTAAATRRGQPTAVAAVAASETAEGSVRTTAPAPESDTPSSTGNGEGGALPKVVLPNVSVRPDVSPSEARLSQSALTEVEGSTKAGDATRAHGPAEPPPVDAKARTEINAAVARFARALESRDIETLKRAYPGLTMKERETWTNFFRSSESVRAQFIAQDFKYASGGVEADAVGKLTFYRRDARQTLENAVRFHVRFRHGPNGWVMRSIQ